MRRRGRNPHASYGRSFITRLLYAVGLDGVALIYTAIPL